MSGGRALGIDLGSVRIGLALSDPTRTVATPLSVLQRNPDHGADHRAIADVIAARAAESEIEELRQALGAGIDVVAHDERLTTITAERSLDEARVRRADRVAVVDKIAAAVMLQSWLESCPRASSR
jgi:putative Holliday junction resolvase